MKEENSGSYYNYNADYYSDYVEGYGQNYNDRELWTAQFQNLARRIVDLYSPKTFLDVGCAYGYLVEALRDLGVEAYGVDISSYAVSQAREDIRKYCYVANVVEGLPKELQRKYDCISTVEVIEHLHEEDAQPFIHVLCSYTNQIIFSSTPDVFDDPSHFNVQQQEYWVKRFSREGFLRDFSSDVSFISPQAIAFRREKKEQDHLIEDYEHEIRILKLQEKKKLYDKDVHIGNIEAMLKGQTAQKEQLEKDLQACQEQLDVQINQMREKEKQQEELHRQALEEEAKKQQKQQKQLQERLDETSKEAEHLRSCLEQAHRNLNEIHHVRVHEHQLEAAYSAVTQSFFWRSTWPMRFVISGTKKMLKSIPGVREGYTFLACMKDNGVQGTKEYYAEKKRLDMQKREKDELFPGHSLKLEEFADVDFLLKQKKSDFQGAKISVVTPLYNTPLEFLQQMIDSVRNQTYSNWELCLADGSDAEHAQVGELVQKLSAIDSRIRYRKLEKNGGISENTNAAMEMATGDYIALFDHDDLLHPSALYYVAKEIAKGADFVYTDELTFEDEITNVTVTHLKPDFAIDNLRSNNYICHLTVFSRNLYEKVGGFRKEYDGSQDYDIILRLTEQANNIVHIPHILYYWRAHSGSVASDISAKFYCIDAAKKAVAAHLERCGIKGEVNLIYKTPGFYKVDYELLGTPLISIIIPNKDQVEVLDRCITSIQNKSTYKQYEIIVVENNSEEEETFQYYEQLKEKGVRVEYYKGNFNYSKINNWAVERAKGDMLLFLNNDVEVISPNWLQEMLMYAQREDVGAVGAKLYYPNDTVQHAGIGIGLLTLAGHYHKGFPRSHPGYMGRLAYAQDVSAVTAACLMMRKNVFERVQGFDESFEVAFNDVDLCLKVRKENFLIVFTPFAELYHYESLTRGSDEHSEKAKRFRSEVERCQQKWVDILYKGDPYFNPNFDDMQEDFRIDMKKLS